MDTEEINPFENFCLYCYHFDPSTGACSEIHENVRNYPKKITSKCNGELFKDDPNKIIYKDEEVRDSDDNRVNFSDIDRELKEIYHFKTLLGYGKLISGVGWVIVIIGILSIIGGLASLDEFGIAIVGGALFLIISGIGMVISGQVISCFVSIEKNTRATYELLKEKH